MEEAIRAIEPHLVPAMLVIARVGGLFLFAPFLSSEVVPVRYRVALAFFVGLCAYPLLDETVLAGAPETISLMAIAPIVALEMLFGIVVGWTATIPLAGVQIGGNVIGQQLGLAFAQIVDPATDSQTNVIGQMLFILAMAGFISIDGLEWLFAGVLNGYAWVPIGGFRADESVALLAIGLLGMAFELALRIAVPVLAIVLVESVAMGFTSKTVPQLNILSLGFPLRILSGTAMLIIGLHVIDDVIMETLEDALRMLHDWIEAGA